MTGMADKKVPVIYGDAPTFEEAHTWWYACAECRSPIDPSDKFCRKCGTAIDWDGAKDGDGDV